MKLYIVGRFSQKIQPMSTFAKPLTLSLYRQPSDISTADLYLVIDLNLFFLKIRVKPAFLAPGGTMPKAIIR